MRLRLNDVAKAQRTIKAAVWDYATDCGYTGSERLDSDTTA